MYRTLYIIIIHYLMMKQENTALHTLNTDYSRVVCGIKKKRLQINVPAQVKLIFDKNI